MWCLIICNVGRIAMTSQTCLRVSAEHIKIRFSSKFGGAEWGLPPSSRRRFSNKPALYKHFNKTQLITPLCGCKSLALAPDIARLLCANLSETWLHVLHISPANKTTAPDRPASIRQQIDEDARRSHVFFARTAKFPRRRHERWLFTPVPKG